MKPELLILSGWGPYKDREEVDFTKLSGRGLFLITGATGAGKTTLFDAITYALYGNMSGDMREKSSVRSDFADGGTSTFVELIMQHGGKEYRIVRNPEYLRPKKRKNGEGEYTKEKENAVLYLPEGKVVQGSQEVNRKLLEILALDYRQFRQISMIAQGDFARLLAASPAEKTRIFREIFSTSVYESFAAGLRSRSAEIYRQIMEDRHRMEEDIHMLQTEEAVDNEALAELIQKEDYAFEAVLACLEQTTGHHKEALHHARTVYKQWEKRASETAEKIREAEYTNDMLCKLNKAEKELCLCMEQRAEIEKIENRLQRAGAAAGLNGEYNRCINVKKQLAALEEKLKDNAEEIRSLTEEAAKNKRLYEQKEEIREAFQVVENYRREEAAYTEAKGILEEKETELCKLRDAYLLQEKETEEKKREYEAADRTYKRAAVGIAAKQLKEGEPCPVCGSVNHPAPAVLPEEIPEEEALQELQTAYEAATHKLSKLHGRTSACMGEAQEKRARQEETGKKVVYWRERQELFEEDVLRVTAQMSLKEYEETLSGYERAQVRLSEREKLKERLTEEKKALQREREEAEADFSQKCRQLGFKSMEEYTEALISSGETEALKKEVEDSRWKLQAAQSIAEHLREEAKGKKTADIIPLREEEKQAKEEVRQAVAEQSKWHHRLAEVKKVRKSLQERWEHYSLLGREYGIVKDLDNLASGKNPKRLVFEQYVLGGYFDEILRAANLRLAKMTDGRFELSRMKEVGDGRTKDNLEMQVLDYYTGKNRSVKTLSGGETFKASLALALGMSDVIQSYSGGIRVETLFIDEGFGSLDSESLEQACQTLMSLVEKDRLIGIISHVPELSEKIEKQIVITKTKVGSKVEIVV